MSEKLSYLIPLFIMISLYYFIGLSDDKIFKNAELMILLIAVTQLIEIKQNLQKKDKD